MRKDCTNVVRHIATPSEALLALGGHQSSCRHGAVIGDWWESCLNTVMDDQDENKAAQFQEDRGGGGTVPLKAMECEKNLMRVPPAICSATWQAAVGHPAER
jgi:hypothetical protein